MRHHTIARMLCVVSLLVGCTIDVPLDTEGEEYYTNPVVRTPKPNPYYSSNPGASSTTNPTTTPSSSPSVSGSATPALDLTKANGKLLDISLPALKESLLLVINKSGIEADSRDSTAVASVTETVGSLPANRSFRSIQAASSRLPMRKDLPFEPVLTHRSVRPLSRTTQALGDRYTFYGMDAYGTVSGKSFSATNVYTGTKCLIFLENGASVAMDQARWNALGQKFDTEIYPRMTQTFGEPTDVDGNGKVVICYYKFNNNSTLGYFFQGDLQEPDPQYPQIHGMEVFFMNTGWGIPGQYAPPDHAELLRTLSHEFQHLINYSQRVVINRRPGLDTWIDEGMAESAEQVVSGTVGSYRLQVMRDDSDGKIAAGKGLTIWDGNDENYAMSYTFLQYCKNQASDRAGVFKRLIENSYGDYRALEGVMKPTFSSFAQLSAAWRLANLVHGSGIFGYGSENGLFDFGNPKSPSTTTNLKLPPGGALYVRPTADALKAFQPSLSAGTNLLFIRVNGQ